METPATCSALPTGEYRDGKVGCLEAFIRRAPLPPRA